MKYPLFFILLISSYFSFSQHTISGTIVDETKQVLPFANIILFQENEKNPLTGVVSSNEGLYEFTNVANGNYHIEVSMLGFKTEKSAVFTIASSNKVMDFTIKETSQTLGEIVVKSKRPVIKQTAEKLIVDLENSEMINTNLQDVLRKVPGVLVTNNGISIAGNSGVRILINGKTTEYMDVESLMRDLPADNISKIEVVEQPGAEYEASGSGAIIDIILKKNVQLGTHGSVNAWVGEDEGFEYGTGASIASYKNKLNWQTSVRHSQPTWRDDLFLIRTVGETTYDQVTREPYDPNNFNLSGNIDYYLSDNQTTRLELEVDGIAEPLQELWLVKLKFQMQHKQMFYFLIIILIAFEKISTSIHIMNIKLIQKNWL